MSVRQTANSHSNTPSGNKNDDNNNHTTLRIILNPLKVKHLWNQIHVQVMILNKILCKLQNFLIVRYNSAQKPRPSVELQKQLFETFSLERTDTEKERLR